MVARQIFLQLECLQMLIIDAVINLILGFVLLAFPLEVFQFLGLPIQVPPFYASILGGVLVAIGIALLTEHFRGSGKMIGLGLGGAMVINLYAALVLAVWLVSGRLSIPLRGHLVLWGLVVMLVIITGIEFQVYRKKKVAGASADTAQQRS